MAVGTKQRTLLSLGKGLLVMSVEAPADLGQRKTLPQQPLERRAIHASNSPDRLDGTHEHTFA
jgi:hypothetical protein